MHRHAEGLAILALLTPWVILSLFLPMPHLLLSLVLLSALAALLFVASRWARLRADALGLDEETWGLAAVLSLGFAMPLLMGTKEQGSGFELLCHDCGRLFDARSTFCHGCGSYA